jgi:hypothetical protein
MYSKESLGRQKVINKMFSVNKLSRYAKNPIANDWVLPMIGQLRYTKNLDVNQILQNFVELIQKI